MLGEFGVLARSEDDPDAGLGGDDDGERVRRYVRSAIWLCVGGDDSGELLVQRWFGGEVFIGAATARVAVETRICAVRPKWIEAFPLCVRGAYFGGNCESIPRPAQREIVPRFVLGVDVVLGRWGARERFVGARNFLRRDRAHRAL